MKRLFKYLSISLLLLLFLITGIGGGLLGTQPGFQWLLQTADRVIPGTFRFERLEGSLVPGFELRGVRYTIPSEMNLEVEKLVLAWSPTRLFEGVFELTELGIHQAKFEQTAALPEAETEAETTRGSIELPDIKLPLAVEIHKIELRDLEFISGPEATPQRVDELLFSAGWDENGISLSKAGLKTPELKFDISGTLVPEGAYPIDLKTDWRLSLEDLPEIIADGAISGDLQQLDIRQVLQGALQAQLKVELHQLLSDLNWNTKLNIKQLAAELVPSEIPTELALDITGKGDLKSAQAEIQARLPALPMTGTDSSGEAPRVPSLNMTGQVGFSNLEIDAKGEWQNLQWPLTGEALVKTGKGTFDLKGTQEQYKANLEARVSGADIPPGNWTLQGQGDLNQFRIERFHGDIIEGTIDLEGDVVWSPALRWQTTLSATGLNPGSFYPEWPGVLNLAATSQGEQKQSGLSMEAELTRLEGNLRELPVAGNGKVLVTPETTSLRQVALSSGETKLLANGELGKKWDLEWSLDMPSLADIVPNAAGQIQAQGRMLGTSISPVMEGTVKVQELAQGDLRCTLADAEFSLGLAASHSNRVKADVTGLAVAGQQIETLSILGSGPVEKHDLELSAAHSEGQMQLTAQGGFFQDRSAWEGALQRLLIDAKELGNWQLKTPVQTLLSAEKVNLSPLCLKDQRSEVCTQVDWTPTAGKAALTVKGYSLEDLQPWLPEAITGLNGDIDVDAEADLGKALLADVKAVISPGFISYLDNVGKETKLDHQGGQLNAKLDQKQLVANWKLNVGQHSADGDLDIPRKGLESNPTTAPLKGQVNLSIQELDLLLAFIPQIEGAEGNIEAKLKLDGNMGAPRISGYAGLTSSDISIPLAGLMLEAANFRLESAGGDQLNVKGDIASSEGTLNIGGAVTLDGDRGWPAEVTIKGERFLGTNLPEARVLISPDIQMTHDKEATRIRGKLFIPEAFIELRDLPADTESVSSDVVIQGEGDSEEQSPGVPIDAEVTVELGEVHFQGFGLKTDLEGKLTVINLPGKLPTAHGELKTSEGSFRAYGQDLTIERGRISYAGGYIGNPSIRIRASRLIGDITVGVDITGTAEKPKIDAFSSDPDMTSKDAVSMLLTGQKSNNLANAKIYAGKELSKDLSVGVNLGGGEEGSEFVVRYRLIRNLSVEGTSSSKKSGARLLYSIEVE
ncbi:MAG: hypothetical protein GY703_01755 [Gammaproteobacteria bacterium]|nr:hypothetical protein [Gammaproteobacteria bacterium]